MLPPTSSATRSPETSPLSTCSATHAGTKKLNSILFLTLLYHPIVKLFQLHPVRSWIHSLIGSSMYIPSKLVRGFALGFFSQPHLNWMLLMGFTATAVFIGAAQLNSLCILMLILSASKITQCLCLIWNGSVDLSRVLENPEGDCI